jgi:BCD family chlorophyll transporter-like MFS transporter
MNGSTTTSTPEPLSWPGVARLGLVQAALGAVVVLTTSTLNRVMVVELALPALVPGLLVALHHAVQLSRPRMGFGSDVGGRRTPWIVGGMVTLALGGFGAALATAWMGTHRGAGIALAMVSYALVGLGASAGGTALLVLLAKRVDEPRRASAAALVWVMMIVGFAVTAGAAGALLDPYSPARLVAVSGGVSMIAIVVTLLATAGVERRGLQRAGAQRATGTAAAQPESPASGSGSAPSSAPPTALAARPPLRFRDALAEVWAEPVARIFTIFVILSMLAYSTQDLILEPFAGAMFGFSPGATTQLSGVQHGGTLAGMLLAALAGRRLRGIGFGSTTAWATGGCLASALALFGLVAAGWMGPPWPLRINVFAMGLANGTFSIAAIGSMMSLAGAGQGGREGVRMGLWGAAQALGFALGGLFGAAASDLARALIANQGHAYACVFAVEGLMFVAAAGLALKIGGSATRPALHAKTLVHPTRTSQRTPTADLVGKATP